MTGSPPRLSSVLCVDGEFGCDKLVLQNGATNGVAFSDDPCASPLTKRVSAVHEKCRGHTCPPCAAAFGQASHLTKHVRTGCAKAQESRVPPLRLCIRHGEQGTNDKEAGKLNWQLVTFFMEL